MLADRSGTTISRDVPYWNSIGRKGDCTLDSENVIVSVSLCFILAMDFCFTLTTYRQVWYINCIQWYRVLRFWGVHVGLHETRVVPIGFYNLGVVSFVSHDMGVVAAGPHETGVVHIDRDRASVTICDNLGPKYPALTRALSTDRFFTDRSKLTHPEQVEILQTYRIMHKDWFRLVFFLETYQINLHACFVKQKLRINVQVY